MLEVNKIYNENCLDTMARMPDGFVDLTVTSPPYDSLREYDCNEEWTFEKFLRIARELYRITKDGGVVVWIVGDQVVDRSETLTSFKHALHFVNIGFKCHDTMIYKKRGCSSMPSRNRYLQCFEYMFVFCKGKLKTVNFIEDRKNRFLEGRWGKTKQIRLRDGSFERREIIKKTKPYGRRYNIWEYLPGGQGNSGDEFSYLHPATFPEELANDHIISWSNEGELVYDPFMGSGTTAKMACLNSRNFIGSEISDKYCTITEKRLRLVA